MHRLFTGTPSPFRSVRQAAGKYDLLEPPGAVRRAGWSEEVGPAVLFLYLHPDPGLWVAAGSMSFGLLLKRWNAVIQLCVSLSQTWVRPGRYQAEGCEHEHPSVIEQ